MTRAGIDGVPVGTVGRLARFPVKSTAGQTLDTAFVGARGLLHDREWAAYTTDGGLGSGKTTTRLRKVDGLLAWRSSLDVDANATPLVHSPNGESYRVDDPAASQALSRTLGRELMLRRQTDISHHDECPVHLVTTASLRRVEQLVRAPVDPLRLRVNIVLTAGSTGFLEDDWSGAELSLGPEVVLLLGPGMPRCVTVDQSQAGVWAAPPILRALGDHHAVLLGLQASVLRTGTVSVGDEARLHPA